MIRRFFSAFLLAIAIGNACAHELEANRLTLVMREPHHVSLTLYVRYAEAMQRTLAPQHSLQEFLVIYAGMATDKFEQALQRAHASLREQMVLRLPSGKEVALTHWEWPAAAKVQLALRQRLMQAMVAPSEHSHEDWLEIRAEASHAEPLHELTVALPGQLQPVMLVWYRPSQAWSATAPPGTRIRF